MNGGIVVCFPNSAHIHAIDMIVRHKSQVFLFAINRVRLSITRNQYVMALMLS